MFIVTIVWEAFRCQSHLSLFVCAENKSESYSFSGSKYEYNQLKYKLNKAYDSFKGEYRTWL